MARSEVPEPQSSGIIPDTTIRHADAGKGCKESVGCTNAALLLNTFCHTTANVHCGMMYGKIKMELKYFLNFRFVLVTRNAKVPP